MERIWFDQGRRNFFSIPDDAELPDGSYLLRSLTSAGMKVERASVEGYRISKEEASSRLGGRVEEAWGSLVSKVDALFAFGRAAAEGTASEDEDKDARSPLPENLEDVLGMKPGAILTDPDEVRARLQAAASSIGIQLKARGEDADAEVEGDAAVEALAEVSGVEEVEEIDDAAEPETENEPSAADPLREFFSRPEVSGALAGLGRVLSKLGAQIQEAAEQPSAEE